MSITNVMKGFNFRVLNAITGVEDLAVQKVTIPKISVDVVTHGAGNYEVKTAGLIKFDDCVLENIVTVEGGDGTLYDWFFSIQDTPSGTGKRPSNYKRNFTIQELTPEGTVANTWWLKGAFPKEIDSGKLDRTSSDNLMRTVTLSVDEVILL